jgi:light-regulated signal transduction histidine kinase (bacteriophytochrome)
MELYLIIGLSALLQLVAAFFALKLIRVTGFRIAWVMIAAALCIMAMRRVIVLGHLLTGELPHPHILVDESVALATSIMMLAGVLAIAPLFHTIKAAEAALRQSRDELEGLVAQRTEELRDANARLSVELDERRQAEYRLAHYTAELGRSNAELEQFAYVASHDLQEPLRMVASFTQLLAKRYRGRLDQDADEFIGFAVDGASRMQTLINDLLAYSRVGTRGKAFKPTQCQAVLTMALDNLERSIEKSGAAITHDPLPTVSGDEVQLIQLFQNLIGNAVKFHGEEAPQVHIAAERQDGEWVFAVRDNGIGIAPEQLERIFSIFQRLHHRAEYPGTGIGLAICKKIVERHDGKIWVESEVGRGSTFYFTLKEGENKPNEPRDLQAD